MKNLILLSLILASLMIVTHQDLQVISPKDLRETLAKINKSGNGEIKTKTGRFGQVPFGKSINGYAYSHFPFEPELNDWCDPAKFVYIVTDSGDTESNLVPIVIATSTGCSFTKKAQTAQNARGKALIIVGGDDDDFEDAENQDTVDDASITIPTLIVKKDSGDTIFNYIKNDSSKRIILSLSFKDSIVGGKVNMQLYLRSDTIKALHFFKEFEQYFDKLGDRLNFTPVYKYTECLFCPSQDNLEDVPEDGCFKEGHFCGSFNLDLKIENSRLVLLENLRQKCIYEVYPLKTYWNYMKNFSDLCADLSFPTFNKKCSKEVMRLVKIDNSKVEECMQAEITKKDQQISVMAKDYDLYNKYSVHRYPQIIINEMKYKEEWLAQQVFHFICESNLANDPVCQPPKPGETQIELNPTDDDDIGFGTLILLVFIILLCMLIIAYCYRRIVNRTIDESIEDRIVKQTRDSVGNYSRMDKNTILTN